MAFLIFPAWPHIKIFYVTCCVVLVVYLFLVFLCYFLFSCVILVVYGFIWFVSFFCFCFVVVVFLSFLYVFSLIAGQITQTSRKVRGSGTLRIDLVVFWGVVFLQGISLFLGLLLCLFSCFCLVVFFLCVFLFRSVSFPFEVSMITSTIK